jgi:hypothetical protein
MTSFFNKLASWDKVAFLDTLDDLGVEPMKAVAFGYTAPGQTGSTLAKKPLDTTSYLLNRRLYSGPAGLAARLQADEVIGKKILEGVATQGSDAITSAIGEVGKKYKKYKDLPRSRKNLKELVRTDDIISRADPSRISDLYRTMYDIAPNMTKHKEAVRSFLRQGLMHEGGLDPMSVGQLARSEAALTGKLTGKLD